MGRTLKIGFLLMMINACAFGQQEAMISQYMFNELAINPAYAGSRERLTVNALYRDQWVGLNGAPTTYTISAHSPFKVSNSGVGLTVFNDRIGVVSETGVFGNYSYKFAVDDGNLQLGIKGGISYYRGNFAQVETADQDDPVFSLNSSGLILPNFGLGIYYSTDKFYVGGSIPSLLQNKINLAENSVFTDKESHQNRHYFITGGLLLQLQENIKMKPSLLLRSFNYHPIQLDMNTNFIFYDVLWAGVSYRTKDAMVFLAEYRINNQLQVGYAIDLPMGPIKGFRIITHELMIRYEISFDKSKIISPRYF